MRTLLLFFLLTISFGSLAQMTVDYPYNNQILQRNATNTATVSFLGKVPKEATVVEYQLVSVKNGKEEVSSWQLLDSSAIGGFYQGKLEIKGGLYKFKVRSKNNSVLLDSAVLNRFGVGEVFIIAGQSNAQGIERSAYQSGTDNEMVIAANFSNVYEPKNDDKFTFTGINNYTYPTNSFEVLKKSSIIGPTGANNYFWPKLGEKITSSLQVPVCFFNVAWGGTSIRNWAESSRGIASSNPWISQFYPVGFPFENLKQVIKSFAGQNGIRAVLWQIGETDTDKQLPSNDFVNYFKEVQQAIVNLTGINIPMVVAQGTYFARPNNDGICTPSNNYTGIAEGIKSLWNIPNEAFLAGPNTDIIEIPRLSTDAEGCVHFSPNAFGALADSWFAKLNTIFETSTKIQSPVNLPIFEKYCGENNANNLKLSSNQFNLLVENKIVSPDSNLVFKNLVGTKFRLSNKVGEKINFLSPEYNFLSFPDVSPTIITAKGLTSICAGSNLEIESNFSQVLWNTGIQAKTITVNTTGNYFALVKNKYNCVSTPSNSISLKVFDNPALPTITQMSPYFLYGGVKLFDTDYQWQFGDKLLNKSDVYLKVNQSGTYKMFATKKYSSDLTCKSPLAEFVYTLPDDAGLTVYPNPLFDYSFVTIESISDLLNAKYMLVDELGKMVKEGTVSTNDSFKLELNGLATGKYVLLISTEDRKSYTKRLIVGK